jgi:purine nucleosidase
VERETMGAADSGSGTVGGLSDATRVARLSAGRELPARVVIDTDTRNEIDDQFAIVQALLAPEALTVEAMYAAPFENARSSGPADGMERSFDEIERILKLLPDQRVDVLHGSRSWMTATGGPVPSDAAEDLIERARGGSEPLYVVAIGAPTNVASALAKDPSISERIVLVWLGGHALDWPDTKEFNLRQDPVASRTVLDCGVPLVRVPCWGVADQLVTTAAEIDRYVRPAGPLGEFLASLYDEYVADEPGRSKVIWDMAATGWVMAPGWMTTTYVPSPILTTELTWSRDPGRHLILDVTSIDRDAVFGDLFARLAAHSG